MWKYNSVYSGNIIDSDNSCIKHFGNSNSGRYPRGSGKDPRKSVNGKPVKLSKKQLAVAANKLNLEKMKTMNDEELIREVSRLRLEENYRQLTQIKIPESKIKKMATEVVEASIKTVSTKILTAILNDAATKMITPKK